MRRSGFAGLVALAALPAAGDPSLEFPLRCQLDQDCHIQQFVDHDPGPGAMDFACGTLVFDGHKGTDIAVPSLLAQAAGVDVLASAGGTVTRVRNDMIDVLQGSPKSPDIGDRDCGNGVVIDHGGGWETQYCHMARGSIDVLAGQYVDSGDKLGHVGLSGNSEFPHLHLSVRHNGQVIDPFDPDGVLDCGTVSEATLWTIRPETPETGLISLGFATGIPSYDAVRGGTAAQALSGDLPLVVWGYAFGSQPGDVFTTTFNGPNGIDFSHAETLTRTQAQYFRAAGKPAPQDGWPSGRYTATIEVARDGQVVADRTLDATMP